MSDRDDLARLLFDAAEQGDKWDGLLVGDRVGRARAYRQADTILTEWLPSLADNEAVNDMLGRWAIRETHGKGTEFFADIATVLRGRPRNKAEMLAGALERLSKLAERDDPDVLRARLTPTPRPYVPPVTPAERVQGEAGEVWPHQRHGQRRTPPPRRPPSRPAPDTRTDRGESDVRIFSDFVDRVAANMAIRSNPVPPAFVKRKCDYPGCICAPRHPNRHVVASGRRALDDDSILAKFERLIDQAVLDAPHAAPLTAVQPSADHGDGSGAGGGGEGEGAA